MMHCKISLPILTLIATGFGSPCFADSPSGVQTCALREAKTMALLEQRDADEAAQDLMSRAGQEMHQARLACYDGRNDHSNVLHDGIEQLLDGSSRTTEVRR